MSGRFTESQSNVEALLGQAIAVPLIRDALLALSQQGLAAPETLSLDQVQQVCYVAVAHLSASDDRQ